MVHSNRAPIVLPSTPEIRSFRLNSDVPTWPQSPPPTRNGISRFLLCHALRPLKKGHCTRRCMTDPEASSFCIASVHRSACSCGTNSSQPPFPYDILNQTLVSPSVIPLAYSRPRPGSIASLCGILCLIIIAKSVSAPPPCCSRGLLIRH